LSIVLDILLAYVKQARQTDAVATVPDIRADLRADGRRRVREAMLDAAHDLTVSQGWARVRMASVAAAAGVSRQTLHAELGTKEALGQALVLRETDRYLAGVGDALARHPGRLEAAIEAAVRYTLQGTATSPLLQAVLTGAAGGDASLLPLLTSRGTAVLDRASQLLRAWMLTDDPARDAARVDDLVDDLVRLVVSHALLPRQAPEVVARRLARLARLVTD
jgi:AcrR family transcriptional regulator